MDRSARAAFGATVTLTRRDSPGFSVRSAARPKELKDEMRLPVAVAALTVPLVQVRDVGPAAMRASSTWPSAAVMATTGIVIGTAPATVGVTRPAWLL